MLVYPQGQGVVAQVLVNRFAYRSQDSCFAVETIVQRLVHSLALPLPQEARRKKEMARSFLFIVIVLQMLSVMWQYQISSSARRLA